MTSRSPITLRRRWLSPVVGLITGALLLGATAGSVLAASVEFPAGSYFVYGNASHTLSLYSRAGVGYTVYSTSVDITETRGFMYVQTGSATCARSRVYGNGVLQSNRTMFGSPSFPIVSDGLWHQRWFSYTSPPLNAAYAVNGYWQTHDGGASCGYGGGVAWGKPSQFGAWTHSATSP